MSLTVRNAGLAVAALLILIWAVARHRGGTIATAPAEAAPAASAPAPAAPPPAPPVKKVRRTLTAKAPAPPPAPVRGAMLRDKGEAFGGGTPDRVDEAAEKASP